ncbi:short chain dehydrogenase [Xylariaceae sp. FL0255]|nr:short chain dehydrogenase [Xylariaceae sp. FL0255]
MARIFITGSADGLGQLTARALVARGHDVYLHARSAARAAEAQASCPGAKGAFVADLSSESETRQLAVELNKNGPWDAVVHNAAVLHLRRGQGKGDIFKINTVAPYLLTALMDPPARRYVFISSSMHRGGDPGLKRPGIEISGYSDTKLQCLALTKYFARAFNVKEEGKGKGVVCECMDPGWVPTKMGGAGAPDDMGKAIDTYVMLAEGSGRVAGREESGGGGYWYQGRESGGYQKAADEEGVQLRLVRELERITGVKSPV